MVALPTSGPIKADGQGVHGGSEPMPTTLRHYGPPVVSRRDGSFESKRF